MQTLTPPAAAHKQSPTRHRRGPWVVCAGLAALAVVPAMAGLARMAQLLQGVPASAENARFLAAPIPVLLHMPAAILFSLLGAWQFSAHLRGPQAAWHRRAGRALVPAGLVVALSGLWMTFTYPWPPGDGVALFGLRIVFGTAMLLSLLLGLDAIRRRRLAEHRAWMTRAYAIGMGAGTQVLTHLPWFLLVKAAPGTTARAVLIGLGWGINLAVAEWVIRRQGRRPGPTHGAAPAGMP